MNVLLSPTSIATLVAAFEQDAAVRAIYPGETAYRQHFPGFLVAFGGRALETGTVDTSPYGRAAALWFPPEVGPDDQAIITYLETTLSPKRLRPLAAGMEVQARLHPNHTGICPGSASGPKRKALASVRRREQVSTGRPSERHELRARAFIWSPLRLTQMRCERGSVGAACLPALAV